MNRIKRLLLMLGVSLLTALSGAAQTNPPSVPPIYRLDLSGLNQLDLHNPVQARQAWDTLHAVVSIQGIVNRSGANLFIRHLPATDVPQIQFVDACTFFLLLKTQLEKTPTKP